MVMSKIRVNIVGGAGYTGGELLRLLLFHPGVAIKQITSETYTGRFVSKTHPNLRKITDLKFSSIDDLQPCDVLFLCLPHGRTMQKIDFFRKTAPRLIDLSADFRLGSIEDYRIWYQIEHPAPHLLKEFAYGIPELHRQEISKTDYVSCAGCNATAAILALYPLYYHNVVDHKSTVLEIKAGTSQGGATGNPATHHPERSGAIRTYKPFGHRHSAEINQELSLHDPVKVHLTATSIDMVRGIHCVAHTFLQTNLNEKDIWKIYRQTYQDEPFIRIINERDGIHRLPDPKLLTGSNFCDIGFSRDPDTDRLIVFSAIDNLMKGAAGQAVQAFNIMHNMEETTALTFAGLHPV
jgi:N-acetyl-gamma-glutamyl-phosphate/LysW-gamma-L-alpha-aminoadipyl-6-phosphate reductase